MILIKDKYKKAFELQGSIYEKVDRILFDTELNLSNKCDKRSKVKYEDIFQEITDARIAIIQIMKQS